MTCLPDFLWFSKFAPPVEQAGLQRERRSCKYGASCWRPQWEHPAAICGGEFWWLSAFVQCCPGTSNSAPPSSSAFTAAVRLLRTAKNILRRAGTALLSYSCHGFQLMFVMNVKREWQKKTTLYQVAHTSLQQTYVSPALQQPSCAVSPFLSTTFGLAPLLIKYLTASLGPAPA